MKTWFITDSSSGIGQGIARAVLEKGDNAVVMEPDLYMLDSFYGRYDEKDFPVMAKKACRDGVLPGFKPLAQKDIERIFAMCL